MIISLNIHIFKLYPFLLLEIKKFTFFYRNTITIFIFSLTSTSIYLIIIIHYTMTYSIKNHILLLYEYIFVYIINICMRHKIFQFIYTTTNEYLIIIYL